MLWIFARFGAGPNQVSRAGGRNITRRPTLILHPDTAARGKDTRVTVQNPVTALRDNLRTAEIAIIEVKRQITERRRAGKAADDLVRELAEIIEARDFLRARLQRLEGLADARRRDQARENGPRPH